MNHTVIVIQCRQLDDVKLPLYRPPKTTPAVCLTTLSSSKAAKPTARGHRTTTHPASDSDEPLSSLQHQQQQQQPTAVRITASSCSLSLSLSLSLSVLVFMFSALIAGLKLSFVHELQRECLAVSARRFSHN